MNDATSTRQTLVANLQVGDLVYTGNDHPTQIIAIEHVGGGLVILRAPGGREFRKDSRNVVYVAR